MGLAACVQTTLDGAVLIEIEVQPGSTRQGIIGFNELRARSHVAVEADADQGKANHAVCNVLSKMLSATDTVGSGNTILQNQHSVPGSSAHAILSRLEGFVYWSS